MSNNNVTPMNRAERRQARKNKRTTVQTTPQDRVVQQQIASLIEYVDDLANQLVTHYNGLVDTIRLTNNLGEVIIQALLNKGVLTLEDLSQARDELEKQARERQKSAEAETKEQTDNSEEETENVED